MKAVELAVVQEDCWRNIAITLKISLLEDRPVSDTSPAGTAPSSNRNHQTPRPINPESFSRRHDRGGAILRDNRRPAKPPPGL